MRRKQFLLIPVMLLLMKLGSSQSKTINVYAFVSEDCPISIFMTASLKSVATMHEGKANFFLVFPFSTSTSQTAAQFKTKYELTAFTVKMDKQQRLTKTLGATVTPEVVITGANEMVLYRGRINDAYLQPGKRKHIYSSNDLADALEHVTNGRSYPGPWKKAIGCFINTESE
jgi:peroxiredoxin